MFLGRKTWISFAVLGAILVNFTTMKTYSDQPYWTSFNLCMLLSLPYTCLAHLWVFGIQGQRNIINEPNTLIEEKKEKKVAIVTGSNTGIGFETAKTLVLDYGWEVILACRSHDKAVQAMEAINRELPTENPGRAVVLDQPLDLSSFESVQAFSKKIETKYTKIDALVNNAGRNTSGKSGEFNLLFQSNFLGHFLLTNILLDKLKGGGRIVNLSSVMHHFSGTQSKLTDYWKSVALYSPDQPTETYSASKLGAILFTNELNRRFGKSHAIRSIAVNPGSCASDIWRGFPKLMKAVFRTVYLSPKQGSAPAVAATVQSDWDSDVVYLQPYWIPGDSIPLPFTEMMGPYVGHRPTVPRLPPGGGLQEATALWDLSYELTKKFS